MILLALTLAVPVGPGVTVEVRPDRPYIEESTSGRSLNFDFVVTNTTGRPLRLDEIQVSAFDGRGALTSRKILNTNGSSPGIQTVPVRAVPPQDWIVVFNPFHNWARELTLDRLVYEMTFGAAGEEAMPVKARVEVAPRRWPQKTDLLLPVKGRLIVWDGHDFYSHHRRWDFAHPAFRELGIRHNSDRYAYDLSLVDAAGRLYRGTGADPEDWHGFGASVVAPGDGTVVETRNVGPDRGPNKVDWNEFRRNPKLAGGNYVIIDHGNGEWSALFHLKQGSVVVKPGDRVRQGQPIGQMGFSGDAITVHLHYQLQAGPEFDVEGLPSVFSRYRRVLGSRVLPVSKGVIDTGDIVESR
jgi:Peptidase family M23